MNEAAMTSFRRVYLLKAIKYQSEKLIPLVSFKQPANVSLACIAYGNLPRVTAKPWEFIRRWADKSASPDQFETSQSKNHAAWICEGVAMWTIDGRAFAWARKSLLALSADDPAILLGGLRIGVDLGGGLFLRCLLLFCEQGVGRDWVKP